jgi:hypothetical protein
MSLYFVAMHLLVLNMCSQNVNSSPLFHTQSLLNTVDCFPAGQFLAVLELRLSSTQNLMWYDRSGKIVDTCALPSSVFVTRFFGPGGQSLVVDGRRIAIIEPGRALASAVTYAIPAHCDTVIGADSHLKHVVFMGDGILACVDTVSGKSWSRLYANASTIASVSGDGSTLAISNGEDIELLSLPTLVTTRSVDKGDRNVFVSALWLDITGRRLVVSGEHSCRITDLGSSKDDIQIAEGMPIDVDWKNDRLLCSKSSQRLSLVTLRGKVLFRISKNGVEYYSGCSMGSHALAFVEDSQRVFVSKY